MSIYVHVFDENSNYDADDGEENNECLVVQLCPLEQIKTALTPFHQSRACKDGHQNLFNDHHNDDHHLFSVDHNEDEHCNDH